MEESGGDCRGYRELGMRGLIERIRVYPAKGEMGRDVPEAHLIENMGLEGDFHAKGGERQISLLFSGGSIDSQDEQGLCSVRFRENICINFSGPVFIKAGLRLTIGKAILEITGETKYCHEGCPLYEEGKQCSLAGLNLFARVLESGFIRVGEGVDL